ncbi:hypothetical protein ACEPAI_3517 [Sanghuangporus weigelae]
MLFLGSSGVGKTELDQSITKLEKNHRFVRIDMSEFQEPHPLPSLYGAPKSYMGYGDGGALTRPLKKNPKAVVLLDEIEKAHPDVLNTFLQVFDDGRITDSEDGVKKSRMLRRCSVNPKRDEFIGRIDQIVVFLPLSQEEIETAVQRELAMWCRRADEKHKIKLTWTDEVVRKLASFYDVNYGVRSVTNEVQRIAMQLFSDAHTRGQLLDDWQAELGTNEVGDVVMKACSKVPEDGYGYFSDFLWCFA